MQFNQFHQLIPNFWRVFKPRPQQWYTALGGENPDERRKKLGLMSLEQRRERDLIEVFKILKRLTRIDPNKFYEVRDA